MILADGSGRPGAPLRLAAGLVWPLAMIFAAPYLAELKIWMGWRLIELSPAALLRVFGWCVLLVFPGLIALLGWLAS